MIPAVPANRLEGKRGLIVGIANEQSIASVPIPKFAHPCDTL
jgi:hypothetical protein